MHHNLSKAAWPGVAREGQKKKTLRGGIRRVFVELMVIETTTSSMRTKRSTN